MTENSSKLSPKALQIMEKAKELFWKHGISRVTVTEICREAGVSKMTFYRHFDSKVDLAKQAMKASTDEAWEKYTAIMSQDIPFADKMKQSVLLKFEGTKDISEELIRDIYKNPELGMMEFMQEMTQESMKRLIMDYIKAQENGEIRKDLNPQFIMYFMNQMGQMLSDPALAAMYPTPNDLIMELFNFFLYGIMPRE